ncbi:hypothetical protein P280DRAFT_523314 [Massarina eburnea CBS 473.64]|uniref:Uncharacterized protein n=1 Tax=Massarina eburnea CBS 473.64 TaxID=1395130 RepID=A0A6A6RJK6_9PLEO|nr:hypothetical protein P280DRAFT_523314 [Massarina eburnea CBS 473.64]
MALMTPALQTCSILAASFAAGASPSSSIVTFPRSYSTAFHPDQEIAYPLPSGIAPVVSAAALSPLAKKNLYLAGSGAVYRTLDVSDDKRAFETDGA